MISISESEFERSDTMESSEPLKKSNKEAEWTRSMTSRETYALLHGELVHKDGRWPYLLQSEEAELIRVIVEWPQESVPPRTLDVPILVPF
jgi:hypothetical protein